MLSLRATIATLSPRRAFMMLLICFLGHLTRSWLPSKVFIMAFQKPNFPGILQPFGILVPLAPSPHLAAILSERPMRGFPNLPAAHLPDLD